MVARSLKHMLGALMRACPSAKIAPGPTLLLLLNSLLGTPPQTTAATATKNGSSAKATSDLPLPVPPPTTTESLNGSTKGKKGGKAKGGAPAEGLQGGTGVPAPVAADPAMTHQSLWAAVRSDVSCHQFT
jgi:Translation initiation factor eIF3 subunit 135